MDGGMRPNFPPRFDGPPGFRGPAGHFDEFQPRPRRYDDRRRFPKQYEHENDVGAEDYERGVEQRRSRWGGNSPCTEEEQNQDRNDEVTENTEEPNKEYSNDYASIIENNSMDDVAEDSSRQKAEAGNTTPLRDEVENDGAMKKNIGADNISERNESDVTLNAENAEVQEEA